MDPEEERAALYLHLITTAPTPLVIRLSESLATLIDYEADKERYLSSLPPTL